MKYVFNLGIIGAIAGLFGVVRHTRNAPLDWRTVLVWLGWGVGVAVAIGNVALADKDEAYLDAKHPERALER